MADLGGKLLPILQQVRNKSGSIPISPSSHIQLKKSLNKVPFGLKIPGMSGVMTQGNIMSGLGSLLSIFGSFANMGNFQSILGQMQKGTASLGQLTGALGGAGSISAALLAYSPPPIANNSSNTTSNTSANTASPLTS